MNEALELLNKLEAEKETSREGELYYISQTDLEEVQELIKNNKKLEAYVRYNYWQGRVCGLLTAIDEIKAMPVLNQ